MAAIIDTISMNDSMFFENTFLVTCSDTHEAIVIDPGAWRPDDLDSILSVIQQRGAKVKAVVNTHGHLDHIAGNSALQSKTGAEILIHSADAPMLTDSFANGSSLFGMQIRSPKATREVRDGEDIIIGKVRLKVLHTPGHTPGGISLFGEGVVFSGDTLFHGGVGRTDLPGGSQEDLVRSIREKLFTLPDETVVHSGHGEPTTIGHEKKNNPFVRP